MVPRQHGARVGKLPASSIISLESTVPDSQGLTPTGCSGSTLPGEITAENQPVELNLNILASSEVVKGRGRRFGRSAWKRFISGREEWRERERERRKKEIEREMGREKSRERREVEKGSPSSTLRVKKSSGLGAARGHLSTYCDTTTRYACTCVCVERVCQRESFREEKRERKRWKERVRKRGRKRESERASERDRERGRERERETVKGARTPESIDTKSMLVTTRARHTQPNVPLRLAICLSPAATNIF